MKAKDLARFYPRSSEELDSEDFIKKLDFSKIKSTTEENNLVKITYESGLILTIPKSTGGGGGGGGSQVNVVQTTGDSTTDVMSQKAVTDLSTEVSDKIVKKQNIEDSSLSTNSKKIVGAINELHSNFKNLTVASIKVIESLPEKVESLTNNTLYYVGLSSPYRIFYYLDNVLYDFGTTSVDLQDYVKTTYLIDKLSEYVSYNDYNTDLNNLGDRIEEVRNTKQDVLTSSQQQVLDSGATKAKINSIANKQDKLINLSGQSGQALFRSDTGVYFANATKNNYDNVENIYISSNIKYSIKNDVCTVTFLAYKYDSSVILPEKLRPSSIRYFSLCNTSKQILLLGINDNGRLTAYGDTNATNFFGSVTYTLQ